MSSFSFDAPDLLNQFSSNIVKRNVGIIEFAESKDFCGGHLYPRQRTLLKLIFLEDLSDYDKKVIEEWQHGDPEITAAPYMMERYQWLKDNGYPHFRIIQLVGGRRSGKGHMTALAMAYKMYMVQQIDNPGLAFGIERGKPIYFSVVAAALDQAQEHQFGDLQNAILNCQYFNDIRGRTIQTQQTVYTKYDLRRKLILANSGGSRIDKDLATLIAKAHGTNSKTIRGSATLAFCFDEMAHLVGGESRMSDTEVWKAITPSLNQFEKEALIFANSSPYHKQGKFYDLYEQILQLEKLDPETPFEKWPYKDHLMLQYPSWSIYKDWETDPYWSLIGPEMRSPDEDLATKEEELSDPVSFKVEIRSQFAEVTDAFLREEYVDRMFDPVYNREILGRDLEPTTGAVAFTQYKGHGDPSSTGANFGLAVGHLETVINNLTGIEEPHVVFDFIDAFYPKDFDNETIDWLQVVPVITKLINDFRPYEWTFDQFDNRMAIQQLTENLGRLGIQETMVYQKPASRQSNAMRAKNFRAALNLGRVHAPHPSQFNPNARVNSIELALLEMKFLQEKPAGSGIVDKQKIGPVRTKDIADAIFEVTDALIGDNISQLFDNVNVGASFGAPGGYTIGNPGGNTDNFGELGGWYQYTGRSVRGKVPRMPERGRGYGR